MGEGLEVGVLFYSGASLTSYYKTTNLAGPLIHDLVSIQWSVTLLNNCIKPYLLGDEARPCAKQEDLRVWLELGHAETLLATDQA